MLGLPTSSSNADIDSQARTITSKLKLTDLQDPAKVDKLVARFRRPLRSQERGQQQFWRLGRSRASFSHALEKDAGARTLIASRRAQPLSQTATKGTFR